MDFKLNMRKAKLDVLDITYQKSVAAHQKRLANKYPKISGSTGTWLLENIEVLQKAYAECGDHNRLQIHWECGSRLRLCDNGPYLILFRMHFPRRVKKAATGKPECIFLPLSEHGAWGEWMTVVTESFASGVEQPSTRWPRDFKVQSKPDGILQTVEEVVAALILVEPSPPSHVKAATPLKKAKPFAAINFIDLTMDEDDADIPSPEPSPSPTPSPTSTTESSCDDDSFDAFEHMKTGTSTNTSRDNPHTPFSFPELPTFPVATRENTVGRGRSESPKRQECRTCGRVASLQWRTGPAPARDCCPICRSLRDEPEGGRAFR